MASATEARERLEEEDFEVPDGKEFDPVQWLNTRLAHSGVDFDRLDQYLSSLGMSCQLRCQDTSESIEVASNQLVTQLPSTGRDLERMHQEALRGHAQLGGVIQGLTDVDDRKRSGLQGLAETDAVKTRVEMACSALREVGSWERKVKDCEQQVHSGNLPAALGQLISLKGVLEAFKMMPEYARKEEQLGQVEESLIGTTHRRAKFAIERNSATDLRACNEVFTGMQRQNETAKIVNAVFIDLAEKAWQAQDPGNDSSPVVFANAAQSVFKALVQSIEERWSLLQLLEKTDDSIATVQENKPKPAIATKSATSRVAVSAIQAALGVLSGKLRQLLTGASLSTTSNTNQGDKLAGEESSYHARAARAVALLAAYVDGFKTLATCAPMTESPSIWLEVCSDSEDTDVLPWALLIEVTTFTIWRRIQDDAMALVPPTHGQMRPSEAVLAAESNAKRLLQMPSVWAKRLEEQGAAQLAVLWLACIDETCASYWHQWDKLVETFRNTLEQKQPSEGASTGTIDCAYDPSLLNECMQLHSMLHDSIPAQFRFFQTEVFQLAARMHTTCESPFGQALVEKLRDPNIWCDRIAIPSSDALRSAHGALEGANPSAATYASRVTHALPASATALTKIEKQVKEVVTQCCVQPVAAALNTYHKAPEWIRTGEVLPIAGGVLPLTCITVVGEHLFALVPQLERSQDASQPQWLPTILEAVVEIAVKKVLQIKQLSQVGAQQLTVDLEYLQKVTDALGSGSAPGVEGTSVGAATQIGEILEALKYLSVQQRLQQQCIAKGEAFVEGQREGLKLGRQTERTLRAAMGL